MDALSKTFYTKEASYWGASFTCLVYRFLAWKFIILFSQTTLLDVCVHVLVVWVSSFWLRILHKVFKNQLFLRTMVKFTLVKFYFNIRVLENKTFGQGFNCCGFLVILDIGGECGQNAATIVVTECPKRWCCGWNHDLWFAF